MTDPENDHPVCLDDINAACAEREATPQLFMSHSIQVYLVKLPFLYTTLFIDI